MHPDFRRRWGHEELAILISHLTSYFAAKSVIEKANVIQTAWSMIKLFQDSNSKAQDIANRKRVCLSFFSGGGLT